MFLREESAPYNADFDGGKEALSFGNGFLWEISNSIAPEWLGPTQEMIFDENLDCGEDKSIVIEGGYDTGYNGNDGYTTLSGSLTVTLGSLETDRFIIR